jgi:hypothetical protein
MMKRLDEILLNLPQIITFLNNKEFDLNELNSTTVDGLWSEICIAVFGKYEKNIVMSLYNAWQRNSRGFKHTIESQLKKSNENIEKDIEVNHKKSNKKFIILISHDQWISLQSLKTGKDRKMFRVDFSRLLTMELQKQNVDCSLRCNFNYFKKIDGQKTGSAFWKGAYYCIQNQCSNTFDASIQNYIIGEVVKVIVLQFGNNQHKLCHYPERCDGNQRKRLRLFTGAYGVLNTQINNFLENSKMKDGGY